ncbi:MAG: hypothetical protein ACSHX0_04935 [Akkermansiaceae bacterium]
MTIALVLLGAFSLITLKGSIDLTAPRRWTIYQTMTNAYMSYEQAYAERISFEVINDTDVATNGASPWPIYPLYATLSDVNLGTLPSGVVLTGTVTRTRVADTNNMPAAGGSVGTTIADNPAEVETWSLQSILTYTINSNTYYKSRTVVRSQ